MSTEENICQPAAEILGVLRITNTNEQPGLADRLRRLDDKSVSYLIETLRASDDYTLRRAAARGLGYINAPSTVQALVEATHDESEAVGAAAIEALCRTGDKRFLNLVLEAVHSPSGLIRENAVYSILSFDRENSDLLHIVIEALEDESHFVREAAAYALSGIKRPQATRALIRTLGDEDQEVQDAAIQALSATGSFAVDFLTAALAEDGNEMVKMLIGIVLDKIRHGDG